MIPFFSEPGVQRLDEIAKPGLLCVFDFDGTLSPIVDRPEQARLPDEALQRLITLSGLAPLAIITGRSVADIRARLEFEPDFVIGNHGSEGMPGWEVKSEYYENLCKTWEALLAAALKDNPLLESGIWVENKRYSLSVHYRRTQDSERAYANLVELFRTAMPEARVVAGKSVFNLVPQDAPDKGTALEQLMRTCGAPSAIYVGDDVTDEDVFRLRRPDLLTVRIEPMVGSAAEFFLYRRNDILRMLDELIARLSAFQTADKSTEESATK